MCSQVLTRGETAAQVREDEAGDLTRGTRITLHLKEDAAELADAAKLGSLIKQYSEFIQFPIRLWGPKTDYEQVALKEFPFTTPLSPLVQHLGQNV